MVTGCDWSTPTAELLNQCGWLSVYQLGVYHAVLIVYKAKRNKLPKYVHDMHHLENFTRSTRQAEDQQIRLRGIPRTELSKASFRWRAAEYYNRLPKIIRENEDLNSFKRDLKSWIRDNLSIY